jgi:glycogen(starch) synthase
MRAVGSCRLDMPFQKWLTEKSTERRVKCSPPHTNHLGRWDNYLEIAMFVWEFPPRVVGGLGTYAAEISTQFVRMGHDVTVFTLNAGGLTTRDVWSGVEVHRPLLVNIIEAFPNFMIEDIRKRYHNVDFLANILCYNISSAQVLANDLIKGERRQFDIIVAHDWLSIVGGMISHRETNRPLVFHVHSTEKGRTLGGGSQYISELELQGGLTADRVITVSSAMRDELISLNFPEGKTSVCGNGVNTEKYDPVRISVEAMKKLREFYGIADDEKMILYIGRLITIKGVDRLVMAMPSILKKIPKAKLVVVGLGDLQRYLVDLVRALGLQNAVRTRYDWLSEEERILHFAACDVCALPSLYEPFGIVCLEAMSMAKPVVVGAAGVSGMRDIVVHTGQDQCGYHINPSDPEDIAWGVVNVLQDSAHSETLGKNARKRATENYTWEAAAKNTANVYEEILRSNSRSD